MDTGICIGTLTADSWHLLASVSGRGGGRVFVVDLVKAVAANEEETGLSHKAHVTMFDGFNVT
jgi:hypothetical protein